MDDDLINELSEAVRQQRPYAGFFFWPNRPFAERGLVATFSEAAASEPGLPFRNIRSRAEGEDPPDCEAIDSHGRLIAIEVTELVDGTAIAEVRRTGRNLVATWDSSRIRTRIEELLRTKDAKVLNGGPYDEYVVLIHTDEMMITSDAIIHALNGYSLPRLKQVHRAYVFLSYQDGEYPFVGLV